MTLKQLKEELKQLHKQSIEEEIERKFWNSLKSRRDWCREQGMTKEADEIDKTLPTEKVKSKISTVVPASCRYIEIFDLLKEEDRRMSIMAFLNGRTYKQIARATKYSYAAIKFKFAGGERDGRYYIGIYQKILNIINGEG